MVGFYAELLDAIYFLDVEKYNILFQSIPAVCGYNTGLLNTSTGGILIPTSGQYQINCNVTFEWNLLSTSKEVSVFIEVNGTRLNMENIQQITTNDQITFTFSGSPYLTTGSDVKVFIKVPKIDTYQQSIKKTGSSLSMFLI
jgi:hypothetical protein